MQTRFILSFFFAITFTDTRVNDQENVFNERDSLSCLTILLLSLIAPRILAIVFYLQNPDQSYNLLVNKAYRAPWINLADLAGS